MAILKNNKTRLEVLFASKTYGETINHIRFNRV